MINSLQELEQKITNNILSSLIFTNNDPDVFSHKIDTMNKRIDDVYNLLTSNEADREKRLSKVEKKVAFIINFTKGVIYFSFSTISILFGLWGILK